jgi:hypothetical protein
MKAAEGFFLRDLPVESEYDDKLQEEVTTSNAVTLPTGSLEGGKAMRSCVALATCD